MRKRTCVIGALAGAGLFGSGVPALADSAENDGLNIGNDNNLSAVPVQLCGNNVAAAGAVVPLASPQSSECVNAPVVDHPKVQPEKPEHGKSVKSEHGKPVHEAPQAGSAEELPAAPTPKAVQGHHAVTG